MFEISNVSSQTILRTIDQAEFKIGITFRWEIIIARYTMAFWFMFSDNMLRLRIPFTLFCADYACFVPDKTETNPFLT